MVKGYYLNQSEGKRSLNGKSLGKSFLLLFVALTLINIVMDLFKDTSHISVDHGTSREKVAGKAKGKIEVDQNVGEMLGHSARMAKKGKGSNKKQGTTLDLTVKYQAKQVFVRDESSEDEKSFLTGSNFIGKLITSIDTRENNQLYKILLPYGGKAKNGIGLPKNTMLFAKIKYSGKGKKVFLAFSRGVLPSGKEFPIEGQALSSSDYSPGLIGQFHGKGATRLGTTLGLTMVSGMTDVLVEKKEVGKNGAVTPKATIKNGLLQGFSQATQFEATRQAGKLMAEKEYVTIDSGKDLIVNLTKGFNYDE